MAGVNFGEWQAKLHLAKLTFGKFKLNLAIKMLI